MVDLHTLLINSNPEGWDGLRECSEQYPRGVSSKEAAELLVGGGYEECIIVPAQLVFYSGASRRIRESGERLEGVFVVYRPFKKEVGSDFSCG